MRSPTPSLISQSRTLAIVVMLLALPAIAMAQGGQPAARTPRADSLREVTRLDIDGTTSKAREMLQALIASAPDPLSRSAAQRAMAMSYAFDSDCGNAAAFEDMVIAYWATREQAEPQNAFYQQGEMANEAARVCIDAGDLDAAERYYRRGTALGLKEPEPRTHPASLWHYRLEHALGRLAARRGNKSDAQQHIAQARRILDGDPAMAAAQERFFPYLVGYVALYTNDLAAAETQLTSMLSVQGNQSDPFMTALLGMTYEKMGQGTKAQDFYRKAYDLATAHTPPAAFARPFARKKLGGQGIPTRLADSTFWRLMNDYSEPWGTFRSENFVSNETSLQWVIPQLQKTIKPGGVYLGVAPDQNFTYILALKPSIAFIVDIRHQNAMQHLMYKAIFEMTNSRAEFLSMLFSKAQPIKAADTTSAIGLFQLLQQTPSDSATYVKNFAAIKDRLTRVHRFALNDSELVSLDCVYGSFFSQGPLITYNYSSSCRNPGGFGGGRGAVGPGFRGGGGFMPTYLAMIAETDGTGLNRSYIANEVNFRAIKDFEERNLIVPLTGNFAGDKALRTVGTYVRDRGAKITAFYVSNVEQYLFQQADEATRFYKNVETLPLDSTSQFIRSSSGGFGGGGGGSLQQQSGRSYQLISSILDMVKAFNAGELATYYQVIQLSHQ
ncbi:MAG: hypothetical protein ABJE47_18780 [bacterium]